jgi:hypothetical protein
MTAQEDALRLLQELVASVANQTVAAHRLTRNKITADEFDATTRRMLTSVQVADRFLQDSAATASQEQAGPEPLGTMYVDRIGSNPADDQGWVKTEDGWQSLQTIPSRKDIERERWDPNEEHCHKCGNPVGVIWTAPDELWQAVMGTPGGIRCIRCFDEEAEAKGRLLRWVPQSAYLPAEQAAEPGLDVPTLVKAIDEFITVQTGFDVDDAEAIAAIYTRLRSQDSRLGQRGSQQPASGSEGRELNA